jgi:hypothetical protein
MKLRKRKRGLGQVIAFGKHKGKTYKQVIDTDLGYIRWCLNNIPNFRLERLAEKYLKDEENKPEA